MSSLRSFLPKQHQVIGSLLCCLAVLLTGRSGVNATQSATSSTLIVYRGNDANGEPDLFTIDSGGGTPTQLTKTLNEREFNPDWSPDGKQIAFQRSPKSTAGAIDVYIVAADGTNLRQLTNTKGDEFEPSWQPMRQAASPQYRVLLPLTVR